MLVAEQPLARRAGPRTRPSDSPFMSRCCQSMFTLTLSMPWSRSLWITCSVIPMFRIRIFIAGSEFLCSSQSSTPCSLHVAATCPSPSTNQPSSPRTASGTGSCSPRSRARRSAARRAFPRSSRARPRFSRLGADRRIGVDEPAAAEAGVEVQPAGEAVDVVVGAERRADLVDVLLVELLRVVELVAVDQVAQPVDRAPDPLGGRLARVLGLVAARGRSG